VAATEIRDPRTPGTRTLARPPEPPARGAGLLRKKIAFAIAVAASLVALGIRLTEVQLLDGGAYAARARANQIRQIPVAAPRGRIYDRHGIVLVRSKPSYVCAIIPSEVRDAEAMLARLAQTLALPEAKLRQRWLHHLGFNYTSFDQVAVFEPYDPVVLASDLTDAQMARLAEAQSEGSLPGVDLEAQPVRDYPNHKLASHLFGYVGQITETEYASLRHKGYSPNDVIGKEGLEEHYDAWLRGKAGGQQIAVNAQGSLKHRLGYVEPTPGNGLVLTLDWRLQRLAEDALRTQLLATGKLRGHRVAGAVVAIDPSDGGILAMASYPNFDPNDFTGGISSAKFSRYLRDPLHPLYNRAIGAATPTGSTFKMVTGSGALTAGVVKRDELVYDSGAWNCHGHTFYDIASGGLGETAFVRALAASSDGYFYRLGDLLGHARLRKYALAFGLGSPLGIDIAGEYGGNWPTNAWSMKTFGLPLEPSDVCQLAIGQGAMQATPLQIASAAAVVVNGGTLYRPHLLYAIRSSSGKTIERYGREVIRHVPVTQAALAAVRAGMAKVTDPGGTAYGLAVPGLPFGGKTGTAETDGGNGPNTTWFVAYAPADHPKFALAVYMERTGGYGAGVAAPVARAVIAGYFHKKIAP